jgi:hypothetical protein
MEFLDVQSVGELMVTDFLTDSRSDQPSLLKFQHAMEAAIKDG